MAGIARKRKKSKAPVSNRGHSYPDENHNENGASIEDNGPLITPPPQKRVMRDKTNTTDPLSP
jgi:hypothetical protein